jgi:MraZ protein
MFLGEYTHALDNKGRLTLPARWREELGERVVITRGLDQCLFVFPAAKFETIASEIEQVGLTKGDVRALSRYLSAKAMDDVPDKQGRIIIPQPLREFAGLDGDALVVGAFSRIEIWNAERYAEANRRLEVDVQNVSERIGDLLQRAMAKGSGGSPGGGAE